jgi:putative membrane protein
MTVRREGSRRAEPAAVQGTDQREAGDALRRTRLANERTYLAWWRTALTAIAVSLAAGKLIPLLTRGAVWPFEVLGTAFGVTGIALMVYAFVRQKRVEEAIARGEYAELNPRAALAFAAVGALLGLGTILVILIESH